MAEQSPEVEILVHVAAPSRVSDDVSYRSLASAYLGFVAGKRTDVLAPPEALLSVEHSQSQDAPVNNGKPTSQGAFMVDSQNMSFQSVCDNRASPRLRSLWKSNNENAAPSSQHHDSRVIQSSWNPPPSEISDSYPMPPRLQSLMSPSRVLQHYVTCSREPLSSPSPSSRVTRPARATSILVGESFQDESVSSLPLVTPQHIQVNTSCPSPSVDEESPLERTSPASPASAGPGKVVPVTPQIPQQHRISESEISSNDEDLDADITHISGSDLSRPLATSSFRAESEPPPKRPRITQLAQSSNSKVLVRSSSDTTPNSRKHPQPQPHPQTPTPIRPHQDLEIIPPSPPVGISDLEPEDLISPKLADLARTLSTRYRATHARPLEPLERGHWYVYCASWAPQVKADAWSFLSDYLSSGLAGWGVWCRRDAADASWMKLFCWGHVAKHMYLLLYLASGRHMKFTGAEWKDAEGEAVVTVPAIARVASK